MEVKDGKIRPTTTDEAIVYTYCLRRQYKDCFSNQDPLAVSARLGEWLPASDSYRLFNAFEKAVYETGPKINKTAEEIIMNSVRCLAQHTVDGLQESIDNLQKELESPGPGYVQPEAVRLASQAVRSADK